MVCCVGSVSGLTLGGQGQGECTSGTQCCSGVCVDSKCTWPWSTCYTDSQCAAGESCLNAICTTIKDAGGTCDDNNGCYPGLACQNDNPLGTCCIPHGSARYECIGGTTGGCCTTVDGGAVGCQGGICCNSVDGPCYTDLDCCPGNVCSSGFCAIDDQQGFCSPSGSNSECLSTMCSSSGACDCYGTGQNIGTGWSPWLCCSDYASYNGVDWTCNPSVDFDAGCTTAYQLEDTFICDPDAGMVWRLAEGGSAYEPCLAAGQCGGCVASGECPSIKCQIGAGTQNTGQCCNSFDAGCFSDQDCCPYSACNAIPGSGIEGSCEATSGESCLSASGGTQCVFFPIYGASACQNSGKTGACVSPDTGCSCK
jgi:hypothetical protein